MRVKPFLFATTLAVVLGVASAPAEAQFYGGGNSVTIGGPGGFVSFGGGPMVGPVVGPMIGSPVVSPVVPFGTYGYPSYLAPVNQVIVQPPTVVVPSPYAYPVYGSAWGPRVYTRSYSVYGRPYGVYGRRGWW